MSGEKHQRPGNPELVDPLWNLMEDCWTSDPARRPSASRILASITTIATQVDAGSMHLPKETWDTSISARLRASFRHSCLYPSLSELEVMVRQGNGQVTCFQRSVTHIENSSHPQPWAKPTSCRIAFTHDTPPTEYQSRTFAVHTTSGSSSDDLAVNQLGFDWVWYSIWASLSNDKGRKYILRKIQDCDMSSVTRLLDANIAPQVGV